MYLVITRCHRCITENGASSHIRPTRYEPRTLSNFSKHLCVKHDQRPFSQKCGATSASLDSERGPRHSSTQQVMRLALSQPATNVASLKHHLRTSQTMVPPLDPRSQPLHLLLRRKSLDPIKPIGNGPRTILAVTKNIFLSRITIFHSSHGLPALYFSHPRDRGAGTRHFNSEGRHR